MRITGFIVVSLVLVLILFAINKMPKDNPATIDEETPVVASQTVDDGPLETEAPAWDPAGDDTQLFVYEWDGIGQPFEGLQSFGTMHKVGVHDVALSNLDGVVGDMQPLLSYNADRDQAITAAGYPPTLSGRHWRILVTDADSVAGGGFVLTVDATSGDSDGAVDGQVNEVWNYQSGTFTLVSRTVVDVSNDLMY